MPKGHPRNPWTCPKCSRVLKCQGDHLRWCGEARQQHFWSLVRKTDSCWLYTGCISFEGYGYVNTGTGDHRKQYQAHRYSWQLLRGEIPEGKCLLHTCDVRNCVNPEHLYIGDRTDNARDMQRRSRIAAKLNDDKVREIRAFPPEVECRAIAKLYGVSDSTISAVRRGQKWKHVLPSPKRRRGEFQMTDEWKWPESTVIDGYEFRGGGMCPEQYDVYKGGVQFAYLRLRHGEFTVQVPDVGGTLVYEAHPDGDGSFEDYEREQYLRRALAAIQAHMASYSA